MPTYTANCPSNQCHLRTITAPFLHHTYISITRSALISTDDYKYLFSTRTGPWTPPVTSRKLTPGLPQLGAQSYDLKYGMIYMIYAMMGQKLIKVLLGGFQLACSAPPSARSQCDEIHGADAPSHSSRGCGMRWISVFCTIAQHWPIHCSTVTVLTATPCGVYSAETILSTLYVFFQLVIRGEGPHGGWYY